MRGTTRHRRAYARAACLSWLLCVELFPALHLATHDDAHSHAHDGSIVLHEHADEVGRDALDRDALAIEHPATDHDARGLGHRDVALIDPPTQAVALEVARPSWFLDDEQAAALHSNATARASARGPPAT